MANGKHISREYSGLGRLFVAINDLILKSENSFQITFFLFMFITIMVILFFGRN